MDLDRRNLAPVQAALDTGHEADDLLRAALTGAAPRSPFTRLLGAMGIVPHDQDRPPPTAELVRRAAQALDTFAAELGTTASALEDEQLSAEAAGLAGLGQDLWTKKVSPADAHRRLSPALGLLLQRRTWLTLGRQAGFDEIR